MEYLDRLPENDAPAFSLPTTEKRRSGENPKTKELLTGFKISPPKKVKRRRRVVESSTTSETDSELNEALNQANNNLKKPFLVDQPPGPSKSPIRKKKKPVVDELDFSGK